jgi:hypothetical protein
MISTSDLPDCSAEIVLATILHDGETRPFMNPDFEQEIFNSNSIGFDARRAISIKPKLAPERQMPSPRRKHRKGKGM